MSKVNFEKEIKSNFKRVQEAIIKDRVNFIFSNYFDTFKCYNNNTFNNQNSCLIANVDMQKHHLYDKKKNHSHKLESNQHLWDQITCPTNYPSL
jgi:hypothetical protein